MTNIVHFNKSRGFTRMDNALMESLATVDLPARDLRVLMAIARQTIGFQLDTKRITADELGKMTNMRRDVTSKAVSHLLERRIIYRVGGSRGDIGISPVSEWSFFDEKQQCLSETKTSHSAQIVSLRSDASETKTATCFLYTKKEDHIHLPTEDHVAPEAQAVRVPRKTKPSTDTVFGKSQMLESNPHLLSEQSVDDYLRLRKTKRAPVTARVWANVNAALAKCAAAGIQADKAIELAVLNGWQGFEADWIIDRLSKKQGSQRSASSAPDFFSTDWRTDTSNDL
jgi:phage replication O-like protein O